MSLILCPECGAKISDKAKQCPNCGFQSADPTRPISEQDKYEVFPFFEYDIEDWEANRGDLSIISYEDNKTFNKCFGRWSTIQKEFPVIAEVILDMAHKENILEAKMDNYVKDLISKGVYRLTVDKNGEILPIIKNGNQIVKLVRLEERTLTPNLIHSLNNFSTHVYLARILDEIEYVGDAIRNVHIELQNDRLAMADSARDKFKQSLKIQDAKLREKALLDVIGSATDAKRLLMRNFSQNLYDIQSKKVKKPKDINTKASDALQALVAISNSVQTECEGYAILGEYEPCRVCLEEFKKFITDNKLNNRDTLLLLNENVKDKRIEIVNRFSDISQRITSFDTTSNIEIEIHNLLADNNG